MTCTDFGLSPAAMKTLIRTVEHQQLATDRLDPQTSPNVKAGHCHPLPEQSTSSREVDGSTLSRCGERSKAVDGQS